MPKGEIFLYLYKAFVDIVFHGLHPPVTKYSKIHIHLLQECQAHVQQQSSVAVLLEHTNQFCPRWLLQNMGWALTDWTGKQGKHTTCLLVLLNVVVTLPQDVSMVRKNSADILNPHSAAQFLIKSEWKLTQTRTAPAKSERYGDINLLLIILCSTQQIQKWYLS